MEIPDLNLAQKIGQMILTGFRGLEIRADSAFGRDLQEGLVGSVLLFDRDLALGGRRNIASPQQVGELISALQHLAPLPLLVAIDQEGGLVSRLKEEYGFPPTIPARVLGHLDDEQATEKNAETMATCLALCGFNLNFAPVVDLERNPRNPIIARWQRSFGGDPDLVARHARIVIEIHRRHNILCTLKHFPGHGSSEQDSHLGLTDVTRTWDQIELEPFRSLILSGHADLVMTAHVFHAGLDPDFPATLSEKIINGLLRERLRFQGVVVADDLHMKAITDHFGLETAIELTLRAGVDMLTLANNAVYDEAIARRVKKIVSSLVAKGRISEERIDLSVGRILALKQTQLSSTQNE